MELSGRTAVVTGAASGIGLAMTERFLDEGMAAVVMADIEAPRLEAEAARLAAAGGRVVNSFGKEVETDRLGASHFDTLLTAGYDLGPWLRGDGRLSALPYLGAQYSALRNGGFPLDLFGVAVGARARWALSSSLAVQGGVRWAYNLLKGSTLSAVGTPVSDLLIEAGISLPLAGGYAFDVGYRGDVLSLTYDTRVAHGMAVGVHTVL